MVTIPDGEEEGKTTQIPYVNKETGRKKFTADMNSRQLQSSVALWSYSIV
jgi:hypothetical protein